MTSDPLRYLFSLEQFGIKFGLDNISAIVEALHSPHRSFRAIHIAGTNGKGSVSAMTESILRAAGYRTGRFTSPHLVDLTERFVVDGRSVTEGELKTAVIEVIDAVEALMHQGRLEAHPTFFEVTTAAAFVLFRRHHVEVAVCEVGLGGRLDSTNVLSPMATAITSIAFDHQQHLGSTLTAIAAEKAGIIKAGVPVIVGTVPHEAAVVIDRVAVERGAPVIHAHDGVTVRALSPGHRAPQRVRLRTPQNDYGSIEVALSGAHQIGNAVVASRLAETVDQQGLPVPGDAVRQGLASVSWPGRLQTIAVEPNRTALLDAAHNPEGARTLANYLDDDGPRPLVFAAMKDKDAGGIFEALAGRVSAVVLTRASHPRSNDPQALAEIARRTLGGIPIVIEPEPASALEAAWRFGPDIIVAGSIFLLGDVMKVLVPS